MVQSSTLLFLARALGPDLFGAFAGLAALAVTFGTLSTFGTHLVLMREVSRAPALRHEVLAYSVPSTFVCGLVLLGIYFFISKLLITPDGISTLVLMAIGFTEIILQPLFTLPVSEHLALGRTAQSQLLSTLPLALRLVSAASVFLWRPGDPLAVYAGGYLVASLLALMAANLTMREAWNRVDRWRFPTKHELQNAGGYAALAVTAAGPSELDKTLAVKFLPLELAGVYAAGARVIGMASLPVIAMMLSALPRLFREGQGQPQRTAHLVRWIFGVALGYSAILAGIFWLVAPIFGLMFGDKYHGLTHMIRWLCIAIPGMAMRMAAGGVLMALGKPWIRSGFELAGLGALLVSSLLLASHFGGIGMALALACSEWLMAVMGLTLIVATWHSITREQNT